MGSVAEAIIMSVFRCSTNFTTGKNFFEDERMNEKLFIDNFLPVAVQITKVMQLVPGVPVLQITRQNVS